jgi:uncharacterized protein (DUF1501 family)
MARIHRIKRRAFLQGAACTVATGAFSNLVPQLNLMGTALAQGQTGYKALVVIYLDGGNDSWNLLIPSDTNTQLTVNGRTPISDVAGLPNGGNSPYGWYVTSRGGLYTAGDARKLAFPIGGAGGTSNGVNLPFAFPLQFGGTNFAVNPFAADVAGIFNNANPGLRKLSFLANVGPIAEPVRKAGFNTYQRPPQLYSHNDQTSLWQVGGTNLTNPNGWGGMIAGRVAAPNALGLPSTISVAGQTRFLVGTSPGGQAVFPYRISSNANNPATSLGSYGNVTYSGGTATRTFNNANAERARFRAIQDLINEAYPHVYANEFGDISDRSLQLSEVINGQIANIPAGNAGAPVGSVDWANAQFAAAVAAFPNTSLGQQLRQVARMIRVSRGGQINANRQVYFVRTGGYDTHDGQIQSITAAQGHHGLLQQLSQAMAAFNNAMSALNTVQSHGGVYNEVVTVTTSEFARTINSNGNGTDHAWGAVQMIMGGPVNGANIFGQYPAQVLGFTDGNGTVPSYLAGECFNRGEFLPTTAVDQVAATVARWMGVSAADLPTIFPNINNFANPRNGARIAYQSQTIPGLLDGV